MKSSAVFWLDAHWSGGETYGDNDQCPILEEIKIINKSRYDNFIFVDDARLFTSPPQPPHLPEQWADIFSVLTALHKDNRYIVIIEDVIIAVPTFAKPSVADYCQNINAIIWEEYGRQNKKSNYRKAAELIYNDLPTVLKKPVNVIRHIQKKK